MELVVAIVVEVVVEMVEVVESMVHLLPLQVKIQFHMVPLNMNVNSMWKLNPMNCLLATSNL